MRRILIGLLFVPFLVSAYACSDGGSGTTIAPVGEGGSDAASEGSVVAPPSDASSSGEVGPPPPLTVTRLGAGTAHACAVRSDKSVACWGDNGTYQLGVVDAGSATGAVSALTLTGPLTGAVSLLGTFASSCALLDTAQLVCWGSNTQGLLGNLAAGQTAVPTLVGTLTDVVAITGGSKHACLLRKGGKAFCWGNNDDEQLGSGIPGAGNSGAPAPVEAPTGLKFIGSGAASFHTCAIRDDDQVVCWGRNNKTGQLGAPTFDEVRSALPLLVDNVQDAIRVATGLDHSCAIRKGGTVRCWGANDYGQVGFGTPAPLAVEKIAQDVPGVTDAVALALGARTSCVVRQSGKVSCWGFGGSGSLGAGALDGGDTQKSPVDVAGITDAADIASGSGFSCVVRSNGTVACWGARDKGQLGAPNADGGLFSNVPVDVVGL